MKNQVLQPISGPKFPSTSKKEGNIDVPITTIITASSDKIFTNEKKDYLQQ
jgi:hypothetical protein